MKKLEPSQFGQRLLEVFGEVVPEDEVRDKITEILNVGKSALTNYLQYRTPDAEKLVAISKFTNCSIHWLITGEGEKYIDGRKKINLDDTFRGIMREMFREEFGAEPKDIAEIHGKNVYKEKEKVPKNTSS